MHYGSEQPDVPAPNNSFSHERGSEWASEWASERVSEWASQQMSTAGCTSEASNAEQVKEWGVGAKEQKDKRLA